MTSFRLKLNKTKKKIICLEMSLKLIIKKNVLLTFEQFKPFLQNNKKIDRKKMGTKFSFSVK